ncbi:DNA polymerase III, beta subunit [Novosphingobium sp. B1]|nr:DNA polymerase III, beta subunit [Novosphingobium sp. B1]
MAGPVLAESRLCVKTGSPNRTPGSMIPRFSHIHGAGPSGFASGGIETRMKATIERATLLRCLSHVQSVVERRNTIPILSNVLIEAAPDSTVRLMATDLDLQIVETMAAVSVEGPGAITVSAHLLFDIARKLPDGSQVSLETSDNRMIVKAGRSRFQLPTLPRDDFPVIVEGDLPTSFEVPARTLAELIDRTRFAISTEETRYYLNGIFLHVSEDAQPVLKAAATDGHRLARFTVPRPEGAEGMPDVIVPRKCVGELRKLLEEVLDTAVLIDLSASKVRFTLGGENGVVLTSKLIDGTFPDYSRVIPTGNDKLLKLDPRSFFEGVDRVATIATEKTRAVKMALENDRVTLSVTSPDNGTAAEELPASYSATGFEIGFNANYLKDILNQIDGDTVELHLADAGAPTLIRRDDKSPALYVLMPMRV